jgi:hypothetical protein
MAALARKAPKDTKVYFQSAALDAGERAFAYARASGIIGKSFIGKKIFALKKVASLKDLEKMLFPPDMWRDLPSREFLVDLEQRIAQRSVKHMVSVVGAYIKPLELLVRLIRSSEYSDLKSCLYHLASGKKELPMITNIGRFKTIRFEEFPDLKAMIGGTEFDFLLAKDLSMIQSASFDMAPIEAELDQLYYSRLIRGLYRLSEDDRHLAEIILAEEISLRNCVWAMRMRTYFNKKADETEAYLMDIAMRHNASTYGLEVIPGDVHPRMAASLAVRPSKNPSLSEDARESLAFPLDDREAWKGWRWESLLNPEEPGEGWVANPRYFQNAASLYIYHLAMHCHMRMPLSVSTPFCFIKIKQFEEDLLTSLAEGLALGMTGSDVYGMLEVTA